MGMQAQKQNSDDEKEKKKKEESKNAWKLHARIGICSMIIFIINIAIFLVVIITGFGLSASYTRQTDHLEVTKQVYDDW